MRGGRQLLRLDREKTLGGGVLSVCASMRMLTQVGKSAGEGGRSGGGKWGWDQTGIWRERSQAEPRIRIGAVPEVRVGPTSAALPGQKGRSPQDPLCPPQVIVVHNNDNDYNNTNAAAAGPGVGQGMG